MSSSRKKITIVHHSPLVGGAGNSLLDLAAALSSEYAVTVILPSSAQALIDSLSELAVDIETFDFRMGKIAAYSGGERLTHPRFWWYLAAIPCQWEYWRRRLASLSPDIVIANSSVLSWISLLPGTFLRVLMVRETMPHPIRPIDRASRWLRHRFDLICYLSQFDLDADGLKGSKVLVLRDAVRPCDFTPRSVDSVAAREMGLAASGYALTLLYLGGWSRLKGLHVLLAALSQNSVVGLQVIVAGAGPDQTVGAMGPRRRHDELVPRLMSLASDRHDLRMVGLVNDVRPLLAAADVVVFPMTEPHQARPAFEAGFAGLPIVISDFENVEECVQDGVNGLIFEAQNAGHLARVIDALALDAELRDRLGASNRVHAYEYHDAGKVFDLLAMELDGLYSERERSCE